VRAMSGGCGGWLRGVIAMKSKLSAALDAASITAAMRLMRGLTSMNVLKLVPVGAYGIDQAAALCTSIAIRKLLITLSRVRHGNTH
jgi:hypothetical protein